MNINIQINFTSGIGDFYTYFCEIYFAAKQFKEKGHQVNLYFNSRRTIDFLSLFDTKYYQYFDNIEMSKYPKSLNDFHGYQVIYPGENWVTGAHCWEIFTPIEFNDDYKKYFINLSHPGLLNYTELSDFPKLSNTIIENTKKFMTDNNLNNFSVIHFREWDDIGDAYNSRVLNPNIEGDEFQVRHKTLKKDFSISEDKMLQIKEICDNNEKVFVCSNSIRVKTYIKEHFDNVFLYSDDILKTTTRDYSDVEYWNFCLIEFCLISMAKKVNIFTNYSWISNFITYGLFNSEFGIINPYHDNPFVKNYGTFMNLD
jgi:hypothetical protein